MTLVITRATKQAARYTDAGGRERCSGCRFFMPQGTCGRIVGPVSPRGWCKYYSQEAVQRWQPQGAIGFGMGPSLALDFMSPGALDPRLTFTRGSTATYFDSSGVMQTVSGNTPRFDFDPVTHAALGLLIEEQRTNVWLQSADASNAAWARTTAGVAAMVVTANQAVAPDGTTTAARIVWPAASGVVASIIAQQLTATANPFSFSLWMRGNVGGETLYLSATPDAVLYYRTQVTLTTAWRRFTFTTPTLTAAGWYFAFGLDGRDASQTSMPAQTMYVWGGQVEQGAFPTSYIPTTAAAVTRSADQCSLASAQMGFYTPPGGTWMAEFINQSPAPSFRRVIWTAVASSPTPMYLDTGNQVGQFDLIAAVESVNTSPLNVVQKGATTWRVGAANACLNGGAVATSATLTGGYPTIGATGVYFLQGLAPSESLTGYIRRVRYWPRVLSNAEMQSVTA